MKLKPLSFRLPAAAVSTMKLKSKESLSLICLPPAAGSTMGSKSLSFSLAGSTMKLQSKSLSRPLSSLRCCSLDYEEEANYVDTASVNKIVETDIVNTLLQWLKKPVIAAVVMAAAFLMCRSSASASTTAVRIAAQRLSRSRNFDLISLLCAAILVLNLVDIVIRVVERTRTRDRKKTGVDEDRDEGENEEEAGQRRI